MSDESRLDRFEETDEQPPHPAPARNAMEELLERELPMAMRGYDRAAVDLWRDEIAALVERLEHQAPRDTAVKRALDQVGQETAAILQRAHEAADEITVRSRSQADARLRRAEGEAEITTRQAEARALALEDDARAVWDARGRLIDEMRQLADEVLAVADDALERLEPPPGRGPAAEGAAVGREPLPHEPMASDPGFEAHPSADDDDTEGIAARDQGGPPPDELAEPAPLDAYETDELAEAAPLEPGEADEADRRAFYDADALAEQPTVEAPAPDLSERERD